MSDLVERLRERADFLGRDGYDVSTELEAASELDRLREKLAKAEQLILSLDPCPKCWGMNTTEPCTCSTASRALRAEAEVERLRESLAIAKQQARDNEKGRDAAIAAYGELQQEIERLRAELREQIKRAENAEDEAATMAGEVLELRAIVAKLPKTADCVPITPGMMLYLPSMSDKVLWIADTEAFAQSDPHLRMNPAFCYSTRDAADAAGGER